MGYRLAFAACLVASSVVLAQGPVAPPTAGTAPGNRAAIKDNESSIVVSGCIVGTRLKLPAGVRRDAATEILNASEFVLAGSRELLQMIRSEHDGHFDEIAGIATRPLSPGGGRTVVETKDLGGAGKITFGERQPARTVRDSPQPVRLEVKSFTHISDKCVDRSE